MLVRGQKLLLGSLVFIVAATVGLFFIFKDAIRHRFAVGVYPLGETPDMKPPHKLWFIDLNRNQPFPMDKPIVVWIEGGTVGKTGLVSIAYIISDTGQILTPPQGLVLKRNLAGKLVEETIFPTPKMLGVGRSIAVLVLRIPTITEKIKEQISRQSENSKSQFDRIAQMKSACSRLDGYSEYVILYAAQEKK